MAAAKSSSVRSLEEVGEHAGLGDDALALLVPSGGLGEGGGEVLDGALGAVVGLVLAGVVGEHLVAGLPETLLGGVLEDGGAVVARACPSRG